MAKSPSKEIELHPDAWKRFERAVNTVAKAPPQHRTKSSDAKVCPECAHVFQGSGWDGIDAHWKSKHENVLPYEQAWPLIKAGKYTKPKREPRE